MSVSGPAKEREANFTMSTQQLVAQAEGAEAEFMYRCESGADEAVTATLGIAAERIGGGVALSMRHDVTGYWSKALGFGFAEPVTDDLIDRVVSFYRSQKSAGATIQIAPDVLPADWDDICVRHRLRPETPWTKLSCAVEDFQPRADTTLQVVPVGPDMLRAWASATLPGFGMPLDGLSEMLAASAAQRGFQPFAAWEGDQIVATANPFVHGDVGSLNSAATLPTHRKRGAQSALIAARGRAAIAAGCRWLVAETGTPAYGEASSSLDNFLRSGLQPMYDRQNWSWSPDE